MKIGTISFLNFPSF